MKALNNNHAAYEMGPPKDRQAHILGYHQFTRNIVRRLWRRRPWLERDDLEQASMEAVIKGVDRLRSVGHENPDAYIARLAVTAAREEASRQSLGAVLHSSEWPQYSDFAAGQTILEEDLGRPLSPSEVAREMGIDREDAYRWHSLNRRHFAVLDNKDSIRAYDTSARNSQERNAQSIRLIERCFDLLLPIERKALQAKYQIYYGDSSDDTVKAGSLDEIWPDPMQFKNAANRARRQMRSLWPQVKNGTLDIQAWYEYSGARRGVQVFLCKVGQPIDWEASIAQLRKQAITLVEAAGLTPKQRRAVTLLYGLEGYSEDMPTIVALEQVAKDTPIKKREGYALQKIRALG